MLAESFNQMLRSLNSSRERQAQLIADAGHELRTPLTSLRTNIDLLSADARTGMLSQQDRIAIMADVNAQLIEFTTLIGDLVQLARDETAAKPEPLDFRDVVNSALDRVRRRGHGLLFDVELDPFYVVGDSDTLERAITNLLDNAVKWSPPGGTIRVQLEGDRLRVADQGPGIAEEDLPHVFDRFYRADTARNTPGTGLGLSIVAQTITQHGGWVRAGRSAQGGAEFTVQLPGVDEPGGPATGLTPVSALGNPVRCGSRRTAQKRCVVRFELKAEIAIQARRAEPGSRPGRRSPSGSACTAGGRGARRPAPGARGGRPRPRRRCGCAVTRPSSPSVARAR